ncbi:hypothetical protein Y032_0034g2913 [Ancylostoma ceylanicum]|uniref:Uncharacterized protein n=1 Tax=Ancylostoma ceylanicum TaxID=53326 RepID=A0A016UP84_9BILA|nr:hypothetical protein Y032_0034g2913 [Ancylostoma ceylanicum]
MSLLYILLAFLVLSTQGSDVDFDQETEHGHGHGDCKEVDYDIFIEECHVGQTGRRKVTIIYEAYEEPFLSSLKWVAILRFC